MGHERKKERKKERKREHYLIGKRKMAEILVKVLICK